MFAALEVTDFNQDFGVLNDDVEAIAREIDPSLVTYEPFEAPAAMDEYEAFALSEPFEYDAYAPAETEAPDVPVFTPSRGASFGTYRRVRSPSKAYPTYAPFALPSGEYPGFFAHVPASPFPAALVAESFSRAALPTYEAFERGATYPTYIPFALADGPYPGFVPFAVEALAYQRLTLAPYPRYSDFTPGAVSRLRVVRDGACVFAHAVRAPARARVHRTRFASRTTRGGGPTGTTGTGCATRSTSTSTT